MERIAEGHKATEEVTEAAAGDGARPWQLKEVGGALKRGRPWRGDLLAKRGALTRQRRKRSTTQHDTEAARDSRPYPRPRAVGGGGSKPPAGWATEVSGS